MRRRGRAFGRSISSRGKMITQLKLEFLKLIRSRSFLLSFIALTAFVALMLWGFYSYAERKAGEQVTAQFKYTYESKSYFNGLTFALYSVMFSFSLLIPIFVAMTAGAQIAGERQAGTLRMICVRPVSRVSLLLSKFLVVAFYTYLLVAFFIGLNLLVGLCFVGWGDLQLYPGALNLVDEPGKLLARRSTSAFRLCQHIRDVGTVGDCRSCHALFSPVRESGNCHGGDPGSVSGVPHYRSHRVL